MLWRTVKALFYSWNNIQIKLEQPQCECDFPHSWPACVSMVKISSQTLCWWFLKTFLLPSGFFCWFCATVGLASSRRADLTFSAQSPSGFIGQFIFEELPYSSLFCVSACVVVGPTQRGENTSLNEFLELPALNESHFFPFSCLALSFIAPVSVSFSFNFCGFKLCLWSWAGRGNFQIEEWMWIACVPVKLRELSHRSIFITQRLLSDCSRVTSIKSFSIVSPKIAHKWDNCWHRIRK